MKKILLLVGLLSYGSGACAMGPKERKTLVTHVQEVLDTQGAAGISVVLKDAACDKLFDLSAYNKFKIESQQIILGDCIEQLDDTYNDLKEKYFMRGGMPWLSDKVLTCLKQEIPDFKKATEVVQKYPFLLDKLNPFNLSDGDFNAGCCIEKFSQSNHNAETLKGAYGTQWDKHLQDSLAIDAKLADLYLIAQTEKIMRHAISLAVGAAEAKGSATHDDKVQIGMALKALVDALGKQALTDRFFDLDLHTVKIPFKKGSEKSLGELLREEANGGNRDAIELYKAFMLHGGKLGNILADADKSPKGLGELARIVESCPVIFETIDLFKLPFGQLGEHVERECLVQNAHAKTIRAAYSDAFWQTCKTWVQDEALLRNKSHVRAEFAIIFEKRANDSRVESYKKDLKKRLEQDAQEGVLRVLAGTDRDAVACLVTYLERIAKAGIDFDKENVATLIGRLRDRLGEYAAEQALKTCVENKKWIVSPEVSAILKKYAHDPRFTGYVNSIKGELPQQLKIVLGAKPHAQGIDRLSAWMTALAEAGIDFEHPAEKVAVYQAQLAKKKSELPKVQPNPDPKQGKDPKSTKKASGITAGKIVFGLGVAALACALYMKVQNTEEQYDARAARAS